MAVLGDVLVRLEFSGLFDSVLKQALSEEPSGLLGVQQVVGLGLHALIQVPVLVVLQGESHLFLAGSSFRSLGFTVHSYDK